MKRVVIVVVALALLVSLGVMPLGAKPAANAEETSAMPAIDWTVRHSFEFYQDLANNLAAKHPFLVNTYPIGVSWRELPITCIELSKKTIIPTIKPGIAVIANIHGGERESAESAAYFAWWLANNYYTDKTAKAILDKFTVYVIPVMNPDGYVNSFLLNTRQNSRPTDNNGDGKPNNDPYTDTNGDGLIAGVYTGSPTSTVGQRVKIGTESPDWDKNGIPGDDPKFSKIDLNRTFDYMWNRFDPDTGTGANSWSAAGPDAASEPEVQAVQNFFKTHPVYAMATLHTGEQSVLWPWCWTGQVAPDGPFMAATGNAIAQAITAGTGRPYYAKSSFDDYPTSAEMIDWTYGRLGIHSYTIEVYTGGVATPENPYRWGNAPLPDQWIYMGDWMGFKNIWFRNTGAAQMVKQAPPDQDVMVKGVKDGLVVMIQSEPYGPGSSVPEWMNW
ncbi:MAG: M14 family zinc carboxypeptidase [bacterium]